MAKEAHLARLTPSDRPCADHLYLTHCIRTVGLAVGSVVEMRVLPVGQHRQRVSGYGPLLNQTSPGLSSPHISHPSYWEGVKGFGGPLVQSVYGAAPGVPVGGVWLMWVCVWVMCPCLLCCVVMYRGAL